MPDSAVDRKIEEAMAGRVGTNQHSERIGNTLATLEKGKSADIAAAAVGMRQPSVLNVR